MCRDMTCGVAMVGSICRDGQGLNTHTSAVVTETASVNPYCEQTGSVDVQSPSLPCHSDLLL